jgi:hypothetical protein
MERRTRRRTWWTALLVLLLAAWLASACGYHGAETGPPAKLTTVRGFSELRAAFNGSAGEARLVVFFSPT